MKRFFVAAFSIALLCSPVAGQSTHGSIQGVWQVVEVTTTGPGAQTITIPQPRPNLLVITGKHYSRVEVHAAGRPMMADAARAGADELRAVWGPFFGEAGTYEVTDGNVITMRPFVAKNPAAMAPGAFSTYSYKQNGDTFWATAQKDQNGPIVNPVTIKAVRVE